jgi:hypothetical protein
VAGIVIELWLLAAELHPGASEVNDDVPRPKEGKMSSLTQTIRQVDKPSRLQLALVEWQKQLVARRAAR